ncbi:MAG: hypothetical protein AUI14_17050 [Actinobacteria bacterium 13_2_20CM_2_71_6]|nr:MAG: hypothetical protein AUI14_17050 [Actinobacteria bacterium 13_2_20CM_2_71_6]
MTVIAVGTWNSGRRRRHAKNLATSSACPPPRPITLAHDGNARAARPSSSTSRLSTRCTPASPSSNRSRNVGHRSAIVTTR